MAHATPLARILDSMERGILPGSRTVPDLDAAIELVRRVGGAVVSETRTAPGIGSWAFVADGDGRELLLWASASRSAAPVSP